LCLILTIIVFQQDRYSWTIMLDHKRHGSLVIICVRSQLTVFHGQQCHRIWTLLNIYGMILDGKSMIGFQHVRIYKNCVMLWSRNGKVYPWELYATLFKAWDDVLTNFSVSVEVTRVTDPLYWNVVLKLSISSSKHANNFATNIRFRWNFFWFFLLPFYTHFPPEYYSSKQALKCPNL
jgi:hypothetical protein